MNPELLTQAADCIEDLRKHCNLGPDHYPNIVADLRTAADDARAMDESKKEAKP